MQADWPKIVRLAPADMARLPHSIITKKNIFSSKQPCLSDGTTPRYFELDLLYIGKSSVFISTFSFYFLDFYGTEGIVLGLPDGLFSNQQYTFGHILQGFGLEIFSIFTPNGILKLFGIFMVIWYAFGSETVRARTFQRIQKYFCAKETTQLFQFLICNSGTRCLKNRPLGTCRHIST
jgi:hypothetical protein